MNQLELKLAEFGIKPMNADTFTPVPEDELVQLEDAIGGQLPEDYRWFLTRYGESVFATGVSSQSSSEFGRIPLMFFYGATASGNGVLANYRSYEEQFPHGLIPIGEAALGDLYLLAASGPNRGNIYYWCHDDAGWEDEEGEYASRGQDVPDRVKYKCLEQVAPSFTAFVLNLQPDED